MKIPKIAVPPNSKDVIYKDYLVAFFDILGQRDRLINMSSHPQSKSEVTKFKEMAQNTLGAIYRFRTLVNEYFKGYLATSSPGYMVDGQECIPHKDDIDVHFQGFSDTLIIYFPLKNNVNGFQWRAMHALLAASVNLMPMLIAEKIPIRGAIELGMGTEFVPGEIYGAVLQEAYHLESKIAQYPRIVIGKEFASFFDRYLRMAEDNCSTKKERDIIRSNANWFIRDYDNIQILDYLGKSARDLCGDYNDKIIEKGYEFACSSMNQFQKNGSHILSKRYQCLKKYYKSKCDFLSES